MPIDRRTFVSAAGAAGLAIATPAAAKPKDSSANLYAILFAIIAAAKRQDADGILSHLSDDIVWQNSSGFAPAVVGKAQVRAAFESIFARVKDDNWRIFDYACSADRLFMEGVDEFIDREGTRVAIPYAGVLEFRGRLITKWREYYDGRLVALAKTSGVPASVDAMIDRTTAK